MRKFAFVTYFTTIAIIRVFCISCYIHVGEFTEKIMPAPLPAPSDLPFDVYYLLKIQNEHENSFVECDHDQRISRCFTASITVRGVGISMKGCSSREFCPFLADNIGGFNGNITQSICVACDSDGCNIGRNLTSSFLFSVALLVLLIIK